MHKLLLAWVAHQRFIHFVFLPLGVIFKPNMKQILCIIIVCCLGAQAQDSTVYFAGWGKVGRAVFEDLDSLQGTEYSVVRFSMDKPVLLKHFNSDTLLVDYIENGYDEYGNHISQKTYDKNGQIMEEMLFRNDPEELAIFRTVFGATFIPETSNFSIRREYNEFGRETGYFIIGVHGRNIYSRITSYREDRRKDKEILKDHLNKTLLAERRYKYVDAEKRTILEEFDGEGKLVQRVVLFDNHDIIEE